MAEFQLSLSLEIIEENTKSTRTGNKILGKLGIVASSAPEKSIRNHNR